MSTRYTLLLAAFGLLTATSSHAQDLSNRTTAETTDIDFDQVAVEVGSRFEVTPDRLPSLLESDLVATWQRAGGIDPTPFRVLIPAGCFVTERERLHVRGTSCGVQVSLEGRLLEVETFAAVAVPPEPVMPGDPLRLRIRLAIVGDASRASELLSTLGGAEVSLTIGRESADALPKRINAVSGINPTPF